MSEEIKAKLLRRIPTVETGFSMASLHPLRIGGNADYFTVATDSMLLMQAVRAALEVEIPYVVVGDMRSVLVRDLGFPGLVIQSRSAACTFDFQRSQVMAETGYSMQRLVTQAASKGFGGLLPFFHWAGTVGGALYHNVPGDAQIPLISNVVRSLTVLMPPTKVKPEARVVRHDGSWLLGKTGPYLPELQARQALFTPQPILLTAQFQLTSVRGDELSRRFQHEVQEYRASYPADAENLFGPVFVGRLPDGISSVEEMVRASGANRVKHEAFSLDRTYPSYVRVRIRRGRETPTADEFMLYLGEVRAKISGYFNGYEPNLGFSYL